MILFKCNCNHFPLGFLSVLSVVLILLKCCCSQIPTVSLSVLIAGVSKLADSGEQAGAFSLVLHRAGGRMTAVRPQLEVS